MSYDYDDDYREWEDECRDCGRTFTNEGTGIECPYCEEDGDDECEE
jgi:Zn finger protein HypA/HybF involved in hydrogenase expression